MQAVDPGNNSLKQSQSLRFSISTKKKADGGVGNNDTEGSTSLAAAYKRNTTVITE